MKIKGKGRNKTKQTTKFVLLSLPLLLSTITVTVIFICFTCNRNMSDILLLQLVSKLPVPIAISFTIHILINFWHTLLFSQCTRMFIQRLWPCTIKLSKSPITPQTTARMNGTLEHYNEASDHDSAILCVINPQWRHDLRLRGVSQVAMRARLATRNATSPARNGRSANKYWPEELYE